MEFVILVCVAVVAFFVGKMTGKEAGNLETSRAASNDNDAIQERIKACFTDYLSIPAAGIRHMQYPHSSPLAEPLSIVKTADLAHLAISYAIEQINEEKDEEYARDCYKSLKSTFMKEITGKYTETSVTYLDKNLAPIITPDLSDSE